MRVDRGNIATWILIAVVTLAIGLTIILSEKPVNWSQRYVYDSDEPYGMSVLMDLLTERYGEDSVFINTGEVPKQFEDTMESSGYDYLFLGYTRPFDSLASIELLNFVSRGNNVLLSTESINEELLNVLLDHDCWEITKKQYAYYNPVDDIDGDNWEQLDSLDILASDTAVSDTMSGFDLDSAANFTYSRWTDHYDLNFEDVDRCLDTAYTYYNFYFNDTNDYRWTLFKDDCISKSPAYELLGQTGDDDAYFFRVDHGSGSFYFHSIPAVFTNVQLLRRDQLAYAEHVFSYLDNGKLICDSHISLETRNRFIPDLETNTPLSYILSEKPLRMALYLSLIAAILYILFRAKRRRRFIPVIEPNVNTSLDFVRMIGRLYYDQKDHAFIANQMWRQFRDHVRVNYYLNVSDKDREWILPLSVKSKVDENRVIGIIRAREKAREGAYREEDLVNFYNKLKYFYSNCK